MAVIHHTVLKPTKLELLTAWLPTRPWYRGTGEPELAKAGGFRLDDPQGAVGIEFLVVTDVSGAYLVPLTYRGAPLSGAEHALVGTMEHGVLGRRWAYDGCHDPVLVAQLLALIEGRVEAQAQSASDTPDREVTRSYTGAALLAADFTPAKDDAEGTSLRGPGMTLRIHRLLCDASLPSPEAAGYVASAWQLPDDTRAHGLFCALRVQDPPA